MLFDRHHFHFFGNREIGALYITLGLLSFAEGLIGVFVPIYFWQIGFSIPKILFFYFLNSLYFVALTFLLLPVLKRLSDKMMMFLSIPFLILYFLGLNFIEANEFIFFALPLSLAINMLFFNVGYHASFSSAADDDRIGREVGLRYTVGSLVQFSAPFLGGLLITFIGFQNTFTAGGLILFLAVLPLFFFPQRNLSALLGRRPLVQFLTERRLLPFNLSGFGYANEVMVGRIVWPLFIFFAIGGIENFGAILSAGLLAGAIVTYLIGFLADVGRQRRVLTLATAAFAVIWASRPFLARAGAIVGTHVAGNIANSALMVAWSSQYYRLAHASPDTGLFILSREVLYHLSRISFLPILIALARILPQNIFFSASFVIAAALTLFYFFANRMHQSDFNEMHITQ